LSPARRRACVEHVMLTLHISERRTCRVLGQHRSTRAARRRGAVMTRNGSPSDLVELARQYGRYGYRKISALLRHAGWLVNDKRVERIWRREGLKVPAKQPKRGRLWLADGSCIRLRPEHRDPVWSYDFVEDRTDDGRKFRMLNVIDEFTPECLAIRVGRKLKAIDVIDGLSDLFMPHAVFRATSALTTALSSSPRQCKSGSRLWGPRRRTLSGARPGRTVMSRASMPGFATSCWMARSSPR
jgi:putative transposase